MDSSSRRSTTAEGTAMCRALGALEAEPALRNPDHLAHHFVTRPAWRLALAPLLRHLARREIERRLPGAIVLQHVRTRLLDALLLDAARDGVAQVVVLGAGADSRAHRFARELEGVRFFEVDHPQTGAWKRARVRRMLAGRPDPVRYVGVDFEAQPVAPALVAAGFDFGARAFFLWEGVSMYLRADAVDAVLGLVARSAEGSRLAFDYLHADAIAVPDRVEGARRHVEYVTAQGEPFRFGLSPATADVESFLAARGLGLAGHWGHREMRALFPGEGPLMTFIGVAQATVHARTPG
jgi:methyltransferase (TIGR00027 family)